MPDYGPAFLMLVALGAVNFWGVVYLGSYAMRWQASPREPVRREWLDDDERVMYMETTTPAGEPEFREYALTDDGGRQYVPPLPDGIEWLEMESWIAAVWHSRHDRERFGLEPVTFSERGARAAQLTRRWSKPMVAEAKWWLVDLGWLRVTNEERFNTEITPEGEAAFQRKCDGEDLRVLAAERLAQLRDGAPLPGAAHSAIHANGSRSRTAVTARDQGVTGSGRGAS